MEALLPGDMRCASDDSESTPLGPIVSGGQPPSVGVLLAAGDPEWRSLRAKPIKCARLARERLLALDMRCR
jgi:hypothetical protein